MAKKSYSRSKARRESGSFLALPHALLETKKFDGLSTKANKLLLQIARQYRGSNNGDLNATFTDFKAKGWNSKDTFNRALKELIEQGFIFKTRQGGYQNKCSLYALTWFPLDESDKYDAGAVAGFTRGSWKDQLF
jgi:hypothetical protein